MFDNHHLDDLWITKISDYDDDNEMNDFFGEEGIEDKNADDEESGLDRVLNNEKKPVPVERIIQKPQPKLNELTLTGPKGIPALRESFSTYKVAPNADPYATLSVMLKKYEHRAHVMYPKAKFDDVISRCETLGDKRPVKVFKSKTRMGIPVSDMDFEPSTSRKEVDIIETEYSAGMITTRSDSDDDDANYDPFAKSIDKGNAKASVDPFSAKKSLTKTIDPFDEDMEECYRQSADTGSDQHRTMEQDMDECMADFDS